MRDFGTPAGYFSEKIQKPKIDPFRRRLKKIGEERPPPVGSFKAIISLFMATPPLRGGNESPALAEALEAHCFSRRKQTSARSRPNMTQKRALPRYRQPGSMGHEGCTGDICSRSCYSLARHLLGQARHPTLVRMPPRQLP